MMVDNNLLVLMANKNKLFKNNKQENNTFILRNIDIFV